MLHSQVYFSRVLISRSESFMLVDDEEKSLILSNSCIVADVSCGDTD